MNFIQATKLASEKKKRMKRVTWSNFLQPTQVVSMVKPEDVIQDDWQVEDDILTISLSDLKEKMKILKPQDAMALQQALGITTTTKAE